MEQAESATVVAISVEPKPKSATYWGKEIKAAQKRLRHFQKQGNQVVKRFLDDRKDSQDTASLSNTPGFSRLNLFHKNIETQLDMMYGQVPRIDVVREHYDPDDDSARVASLLLQRMLQADVDPSGESMTDIFRAALQDRLLPGLGQGRVRYEYDSEVAEVYDPNTDTMIEVENVTDERSPIDYVHWQDFLWGWCRTWPDCPWVAFRNYLDKRQATDRFGEEIANELDYVKQSPDDGMEKSDQWGADQSDSIRKAEIWEIWCKEDRKVYWWSKDFHKCLDCKDDPLGLRGFFPCPKPLLANCTTTLLAPKADYTFAQDLYNEIDILQTRIATITRAIKVVGVYDKSAGASVGRMLKEGAENDLIPVDNWAMFAEKGALQGVIDWFPVETVVNTLNVLTQVQSGKIEQLYEVTGMSDIMRGANTQQYAAAQTQQMKAKMGSISVQAKQDEFARFCSDLEALKAEIIAKHYEPQQIALQSNAQFLPRADQPYVEQAIGLLKAPNVRWRINIKPESLSMIDYAQLKQERSEFLMSMAQYIQSASSAVQAVPNSMPILLELMKWAMAGFKGAEYLEGTMDQAIQMASQMPPPGQEQEGPSEAELKIKSEEIRQQTEQMKIQGAIQKIQAKAQADMTSIQQKVQGEIAKITADAQRDGQLEDQRSQYALLEIAQELESKMAEIQANLDSTLTVEQAQAQLDMTVDDNSHQNRLTEIAAQGRGNAV